MANAEAAAAERVILGIILIAGGCLILYYTAKSMLKK